MPVKTKSYSGKRRTAKAATSVQLSRRAFGYARGFIGSRGDAKYLDVPAHSYQYDTTGEIIHLDVVPRGTSVSSREGKAFRITSVHVRGFAYNEEAATANLCAHYLVWDFAPNKALPVIADVLDSASSLSFPRRENEGRFLLLDSQRFRLEGAPGGTPTGTPVSQVLDYHVKLPAQCVALCTGADETGLIGNRINGALYCISVGSTAPAADANARGDLAFRIEILDV